MKFVLLSSTYVFPDTSDTSTSSVVEYDSMEQLMEDLAQNNFWSVNSDSAFKVEQVVLYEDVRKHL